MSGAVAALNVKSVDVMQLDATRTFDVGTDRDCRCRLTLSRAAWATATLRLRAPKTLLQTPWRQRRLQMRASLYL